SRLVANDDRAAVQGADLRRGDGLANLAVDDDRNDRLLAAGEQVRQRCRSYEEKDQLTLPALGELEPDADFECLVTGAAVGCRRDRMVSPLAGAWLPAHCAGRSAWSLVWTLPSRAFSGDSSWNASKYWPQRLDDVRALHERLGPGLPGSRSIVRRVWAQTR